MSCISSKKILASCFYNCTVYCTVDIIFLKKKEIWQSAYFHLTCKPVSPTHPGGRLRHPEPLLWRRALDPKPRRHLPGLVLRLPGAPRRLVRQERGERSGSGRRLPNLEHEVISFPHRLKIKININFPFVCRFKKTTPEHIFHCQSQVIFYKKSK